MKPKEVAHCLIQGALFAVALFMAAGFLAKALAEPASEIELDMAYLLERKEELILEGAAGPPDCSVVAANLKSLIGAKDDMVTQIIQRVDFDSLSPEQEEALKDIDRILNAVEVRISRYKRAQSRFCN